MTAGCKDRQEDPPSTVSGRSGAKITTTKQQGGGLKVMQLRTCGDWEEEER